MEFEQKVVIITGASSGIGKACALKFAKYGALLSIVGRNITNLNGVADQCAKISGKKPLVIQADMTVDKDVERIAMDTVARYDKIDVLVNNAGILIKGGAMGDMSNFDKLIATNLRGAYLLTQKCIPYLIETKGNIVTISSIASTVALPVMTAYCMTKAALDAFTRCTAVELGPKNVRVNSVNPGPVYSNIFVSAGMTEEEYKKTFEDLKPFVPLRKISDADDVADLVTFIASDRAKMITGSIHYVDGGVHLGGQIIEE